MEKRERERERERERDRCLIAQTHRTLTSLTSIRFSSSLNTRSTLKTLTIVALSSSKFVLIHPSNLIQIQIHELLAEIHFKQEIFIIGFMQLKIG